MSAASASLGASGKGLAPPYPAVLTVIGAQWRSRLAHDGKVALSRPATQVGRMEGNDVVLTDPLVSRHHCVLRWTTGGYELEDLGSANGTYVQGRRLVGCVLLAAGTVIRVGNVEMVFDALPARAPVVRGDGTGQEAAGALWAAPGSGPGAASLAAPRSGVWDLLGTEARKRYWRVFFAGLVAYAAVSIVLMETGNLHLVPLALLLASALVPVVFVIFCWEQNAFADMPVSVVGLTFLSGGVLGLTIAAVLEPLFIPANSGATITLGAALVIGVVEESAKVISVLWWLRDRRVRTELDGLILGAAAGMGFAALETAGYGFVAFLAGFGQALDTPGASAAFVVSVGVQQMNRQLLVRMALAIFGHGVWTAMVCAAVWRERRGMLLRPSLTVLVTFAIAVGLHALWDWQPLAGLVAPGDSPLGVVLEFAWFFAIGAVGLYILGFFLRESLQQAKLGPQAPPPVPLLRGLIAGFHAPRTGAGH